MPLNTQNSIDLIKQINSLNNDNDGMLTLWQIVMETWKFVKSSNVRFDKDLQELTSNTSKNIWDFEEYKKSAIEYILLAEKLLYPERKQDISDAILTTWDLVFEHTVEERPFDYSENIDIKTLEYSKENVKKINSIFLEKKELLKDFIDNNYDSISTSNHLSNKYIPITILFWNCVKSSEKFEEFQNEVISFIENTDKYISKNSEK